MEKEVAAPSNAFKLRPPAIQSRRKQIHETKPNLDLTLTPFLIFYLKIKQLKMQMRMKGLGVEKVFETINL